MESKTFIASVVLMSVFMAQIQVDAKSCCPSTSARNIYNTCRLTGASRPVCAKLSGCIIQESPTCVPPNDHGILEKTDVNIYCKLGCVYSVCGALNTLQNSDATEVVNGAVEKCDNVCATICTKNSMNAVETA